MNFNLKKYLIGIASLVGVALVLLGLLLSKDAQPTTPISLDVILLSIGCSVIAAALFAALYQSKLDVYVQGKLAGDISATINQTVSGSFGELKHLLVDLTKIEIIPPTKIREKVIRIRNGTESWEFNGAIGDYTRNYTLPELANQSKETNKQINVNIIVLNPDDPKLCREFARFRKGLRDVKDKNHWDEKRVVKETIATIVSAYSWKTQQPSLRVKIGLKNHFTPFRTELASSDALITHEDRMESAYSYRGGSFLYDFCAQELRLHFDQCRPLDSSVELDEVTLEKVKGLLTALNIRVALTDIEVEEIVQMVIQRTSRYAEPAVAQEGALA